MQAENSNKRLFHTCSQQGTTDFLVATVARWDEHARMLLMHEPTPQPSCRTYEAKARVACGYDGKEQDFAKRSAGRISQADFSRNWRRHPFRGRKGIIGKEYAKMEKGREKFAAKFEVACTAGSGSQTSEMEAGPLSAEVEDRKEEKSFSKNNIWKTWRGSRWNAKMDGGRANELMKECPRDILHSIGVAQCAIMHTALPLQAESTKLPQSGRGQAVTERGQLKEKLATLETPPSAHFFRTPPPPKDVCST